MTPPYEDENDAVEEAVAQGIADLLEQAFHSDLGFPEQDKISDAKDDATLVLLARIAVELVMIRTLILDEHEDRDSGSKPWEE